MAERLIETCWRVIGESGYEFKCGIYRVDDGLEVRVATGDTGGRVHFERARELGDARHLAHRWLRTILKNDRFQRRA